MNPFDNLRPMPPSPCGCAPRPWPRPAVPVPITPQMQPHWAEELRKVIDGKQDAISDLDDIREGAQAGATAYQKPEDGVPKTDLAAGVQASLDKADSAYQKPESGIPKSDLSEAVQASLGLADTAVQPDDILSGGKVKSDLLPSYVDDVIEVANYAALPATGESGKIYVTLDTNKTYRWGGTQYTEIANPALDDAVTRTSANAVKSSGIWSAIWGALSALPTGFSSLYDWCVAKLRDKLDLAVYGFGNATVALPDGFSITYYDQTYTTPAGGETITFIGPVPSSNPYVQNYKFYYPSTLGTLDSFDPNDYSVWCLVCSSGGDTPDQLMYKTGPSYSISGWNSAAPTLTLSNGEATGDAPTMTRPIGATSDTLAKASQLAGKQDALTAQQLANIAAVPNKADASDLRYTLPETATTISSASSEVVEGETIDYGEATLADRTQNQVAVLVALDELRVAIPPAVSGKVRDFGLVVLVGLGEGTALTAPALVPVAPTGETITLFNAEGEMPTLADGTTTASGFTVLYFTEIGNGTFLVKGEQIQGVA